MPEPLPEVTELLNAITAVRMREWGLRVLLALLALGLGLIAVRLAQRWVGRALARSRKDEAEVLSMALGRVILLLGLTGAIAAALALLGVDVAALIAGLGLTSVALGFALKDTIEQAITGMLLLFQQPFRVGDLVEIDGTEGHVTEVGIRTTAIRSLDGVHVLVPNNKVYQGNIRNKSRYPVQRHSISMTLGADTDLAAARAAFAAALVPVELLAVEPAPLITFEGFGESGIRAVVRYWLPATANLLEGRSRVTEALLEAARAADIVLSPPANIALAGPAEPLETEPDGRGAGSAPADSSAGGGEGGVDRR